MHYGDQGSQGPSSSKTPFEIGNVRNGRLGTNLSKWLQSSGFVGRGWASWGTTCWLLNRLSSRRAGDTGYSKTDVTSPRKPFREKARNRDGSNPNGFQQ